MGNQGFSSTARDQVPRAGMGEETDLDYSKSNDGVNNNSDDQSKDNIKHSSPKNDHNSNDYLRQKKDSIDSTHKLKNIHHYSDNPKNRNLQSSFSKENSINDKTLKPSSSVDNADCTSNSLKGKKRKSSDIQNTNISVSEEIINSPSEIQNDNVFVKEESLDHEEKLKAADMIIKRSILNDGLIPVTNELQMPSKALILSDTEVKENFRKAKDPSGIEELFIDTNMMNKNRGRRIPQLSKIPPVPTTDSYRMNFYVDNFQPPSYPKQSTSNSNINNVEIGPSLGKSTYNSQQHTDSAKAFKNGNLDENKFENPEKFNRIRKTDKKADKEKEIPSPGPVARIFKSASLGLMPQAAYRYVKPDSGEGWRVVFCCFVIHFFATSFMGLLYHHYKYRVNEILLRNSLVLDSELNDIVFTEAVSVSNKMIGISACLLASISCGGTLSGYLGYKTSFGLTSLLGTIIMSFSLIFASLKQESYAFQIVFIGILFGFGLGLTFYAAYIAPTHWFKKNIGLATGVSVSGAALGFIALSPLVKMLLDSIGPKTTIQLQAILILSMCGISSMGIKTNFLKFNDYKFMEWKIFLDTRFMLLALISVLTTFGQFTFSIFISEWIFKQDYSLTRKSWVLITLNISSIVGATLVGYVSDNIGHLGLLGLMLILSGISSMIFWTFAKNYFVFLLYVFIVGFSGGGFASVLPTSVTQLFGKKYSSSVLGFCFFTTTFIANTIIPTTKTPQDEHRQLEKEMIGWILFGGLSMLLSGIFALFLPRLQRKFLKKIRKIESINFEKLYNDQELYDIRSINP
ncbi:Monocarboxylate transporter 8 [Smittium culicis]|uniref:Monocarboxylate transporter 8 n=1 Tax=Smittium culicis TaxID=133412 RepID=A0A1R1YI84_9FUNG|nr:Monocarboxylate transporter 8 [Smittium culicis]